MSLVVKTLGSWHLKVSGDEDDANDDEDEFELDDSDKFGDSEDEEIEGGLYLYFSSRYSLSNVS